MKDEKITFEELVNRIQNEELIEQINHVLEVKETNVELAHRQQLIDILYKAACGAIGQVDYLKKRCEDLTQVLREEFLINTENYPAEYHKLFHKKFERAMNTWQLKSSQKN